MAVLQANEVLVLHKGIDALVCDTSIAVEVGV